jgi:biotin carboxyl carrier protein
VIFDVEILGRLDIPGSAPGMTSADADPGSAPTLHTYRVDVRPGQDGEAIRINGVSVPVNLASAAGAWSMLVGRRSHEIVVTDGPGGTTVVRVDGRIVPTLVTGVGRFGAAAHRSRPPTARGDGPQQVVAPMSGRIVKVLVRRGDAVEARQPLIVVEAMKMENELRAPRAGIVGEVRIVEGALVESGAVLVVVE